jgi:hypothetical protein
VASTRRKLAELDEFGALLLRAGLPLDWLPSSQEISRQEAAQLRMLLGLQGPSLRTYAPARVADTLLREVESQEAPVDRSALGRRLQAFASLQVFSPYGYVSDALTGTPGWCAGPVEPRDGALRAGDFEVGRFYARAPQGHWVAVEPPSPPKAP